MNIYDESGVPVGFVEPHPLECERSRMPERIELPGGYWKHSHNGMGSVYHSDGTEIYYCGRNQVEKLMHVFNPVLAAAQWATINPTQL